MAMGIGSFDNLLMFALRNLNLLTKGFATMIFSLRNFRKMLRSWFMTRKHPTIRNKKFGLRMRLEFLEDRLAPAVFTAASSGDWETPATWVAGNSHAFPVAGDTVTINGTNVVTISNGESEAATSVTLSGSAGTLTMTLNDSLSLTGSGNSVFSISGGGTFQPGVGTVNYVGTASTTIAPTTYNNLGVGTNIDSNGVTYTLGGDTTVANMLTVGNAGSNAVDTLDASSHILTLSGSSTPFVITSEGAFSASTSTVNYTNTVEEGVTGTTYYNLGVGTTADSSAANFDVAGNLTVNNVLSVGNSGSSAVDTLKASTFTITLAGPGTPFNITSKGAFNSGTSTVKYTGSAGATVTGGITYNDLTINGTGTFSLAATTTVNDKLKVTSGTLLADGTVTATNGATVDGTLGGIGTVHAAVTVDPTGIVSPGDNGLGILNVDSADFSGGGTLLAQINGFAVAGTDYDRLQVLGVLKVGGTSQLSLAVTGVSGDGTALGVATYGNLSGSTFGSVSILSVYQHSEAYGVNSLDVTLHGPVVVWVDDNWVPNHPGSPVNGDVVTVPGGDTAPNSGGVTFIIGTDAFTTIQGGVNAVASGGTVYVLAGSYAENVNLNKSLSLLGPNASIDPNTGTPVTAAVVMPAVTETSIQGSTSGTIIRVGANAVHIDATIEGFTLDGHNPSLLNGRTLNGVMIDTGAGIDNSIGSFDSNPNGFDVTMNVQNNVIQNLERYGVLADNTAARNPTSGTIVSHNKFDNMPSGNNFGGSRGRAAAFEENVYGTFAFNVVTRANVGWQDDNYNLADPSGIGTVIDHNTITTYHRGIFHNLQYQNATAATITNNQLFVDNSGLGADADNFGLEIISIESGVGVTVTNNSDTGNAYGILITGDNTTAGITITGGTLTNNKYGVYVTDNDPQFPSDGDTPNAVLSGVTITGATGAGVFVEGVNGENVGATLTGNTSISNSANGILVKGTTASLGFTGTTPASLSSLTGNYITLQSGAEANNVVDATRVSFDGLGGSVPATTLAGFYNIEDKTTDYLDDSTLGYVRFKTGNVYLAHSSESPNAGSVQRGVNVAVANDTVQVQAGTYVGGVVVNQALTLLGANASADPTNNGTRALESIIEPGVSGASPYSGTHTILVTLLHSNVTVKGFRLTGQNTNLSDTNGALLTETGSPIYAQAVEGIASFDPTGVNDISTVGDIPSYTAPSNINIQNNIIENVSYQGVDMGWDSNSTPTSGNTIAHNLIQNIGAYNDEGAGVRLYNNFYADVVSNQIVNVRMGVQTGTFWQANPGVTGSIANNEIAARRRGVFYNNTFGNASAIPVQNNVITATIDDPAYSASSLWTGIYVISQENAVTGTFSDNSIDGTGSSHSPSAGYTVLNTLATSHVTIGGDGSVLNSIKNVNYGVWEDTGDPNGFGGAAIGDMAVTISGLNISASTYGVYVHVDPSNIVNVSATIHNNTAISTGGAGTGIFVSGATASASVTGNLGSITGNLIGIDVNAGSATISGNHIYNNGTGIRLTNGGTASVDSNDFTGATSNGTDLRLDPSAGSLTGAFAGNQFAATNDFIDNRSSQSLNATGDTFNVGPLSAQVGGNSLTLPEAFAVEDKILDAIDVATWGFVRIKANNVYVTPNSFAALNTTPDINRGVNAAVSGDTVNVKAGTYDNNVVIGTSNVTLVGAGPGQSIIAGPIGGTSSTVAVSASNVTVAGFTITRLGNDTTNWNGTLASAGVSIASPSVTGVVIHDNLITQNRTGIDINNTSGDTVRNNVITDNRTGLIFRNVTDNTTLVENDITNNWTDGIVFLDASGGTNSPLQTALNSTFSNNDISGNWYGQIVDRQTGGLLPAPGTTDLKNFSANWFGTATPVITTANSAEPGYAGQIPVEFGGTATPPGGQPDIAGPASANFDITPLLNSGTDTNVETTPGRGTYGFQGDFSNLIVTSQLAQTGATGRIQEGINLSADGALTGGNKIVQVLTGSYTGDVNVNKALTLHTGQPTTIVGNLTLSAAGATLSPGNSPAQLTVVDFTAGAGTFTNMELVSSTTPGSGYDQIVASGNVTINATATINLSQTLGYVPATNSVFTLINKTSPGTIGGTFSNLVDHSTITINGLSYFVNYEGGDNNDLTLTLVAPATVYVGENSGFAITHEVAPAGLSPGDTVTWNPGGTQHPAGQVTGLVFGYNAFTDVQSAVNAVAVGGAVDIEAGAYSIANVVIGHSLSIHGDSQATVVLSPVGTDTHDDSTYGGTAIQGFNIQASNVDIDHLTIDGGANENFRQGIIADSNTGWTGVNGGSLTVDHVTINNVFRKGIALYNRSGLTTGNAITNDNFDKVGNLAGNDFESSFAIADFSSSGTISGNVITHAGIGIGTNYLSGNPADEPVLAISNNHVTLPATTTGNPIVGMDISGLADTSSVTGNTIDMTGGGSNNIGLIIQYDGTTSVQNNGITTDGGGDIALMLYQDQNSASPVVVDHNTLTGTSTDTGVLLTDDGTIFGEGAHLGTTYATFTRNSITSFGIGISVQSAGTTPVAATVGSNLATDNNTITGNTVSPAGTGILIQGAHSSATVENNNASISGFAIGIDVNGGSASVSGNHIYNNTTGIRLTNAGTASVDNNNFTSSPSTPNGTDLRLDISAGTLSSLTGNQFAGSTEFIDNRSAQNVNATTDTFNVGTGGAQVGGNSLSLAQAYAVEDKILDAIDVGTWGLVRIVAGNVYVTPSSFVNLITTAADIQRGINAASNNDTVNVEAGTYNELNLTINKPLTLLGANAGVAGAGVRGLESKIVAKGNQTSVVALTSGNVTIDGFTVDGDDPLVAGGTLTSGDDSNAVYGIGGSTNSFSNLKVQNNIIKKVAVGFRGDGSASVNLITQNWFDSIGNSTFGYGITIRANYYADITNNKMTRVWSGLHLFNHNTSGGPATWTVSGNDIHSFAAGILYWLQYNGATGLTISNNQITAETGAVANNFGILFVSIQNSVNPTLTNNTITGTDYGIGLTNTSTSNVITLGSTNSIVNAKVAGVYLTDNLTFNPVNTTDLTSNSSASPSDAIAVIVNGMSITSTQGIGVEVETSRTSAADVNTTATINNNTTITTGGPAGVGTGILVTGAKAKAIVSGNFASIHDNLIGIDVNGGSATVTTNHIYNNGTGIKVENGGTLLATNNFITANAGPAVLVANTGTPSVTVQDNDLSGNGTPAINNTNSGMTVDAAENYWGTGNTTLAAVAALVSGNVNFEPILTTGDADSITGGFQPNLSNLLVDISTSTASPTEGATYTLNLAPANPTSNNNTLTQWLINWGDSSPQTVNPTIPNSLTHVYAEEGTYTITATATDELSNTASSNAVNVNVADAALHSTPTDLTPPVTTEGATLTNVTVFHFTDDDSAGTASDYTATVTLGDGNSVMLTSTPSANGQIVANGGGFDVRLTYAYADELTNQMFGVSVTDHIATTSQSISNFSVADAALMDTSTSSSLSGPEGGVTVNNGVVATFTDANSGDHTADFTPAGGGSVTIHWGSGPDTAGTVTYLGSNAYQVTGTHTYNEESPIGSPFHVTVDVHDDGGSLLTGIGLTTVTVNDAALHNTSTAPNTQPSLHENVSTGSLTVATFTDDNPGNHTADFTGGGSVTIHWGDTQTSAGTVTYDAGSGTYTVSGSHTYAQERNTPYSVTVDVVDDGSSTLTAIGLVQVTVDDLPPVVASAFPSVTVPENQTASMSGTFSDYDENVQTIAVTSGLSHTSFFQFTVTGTTPGGGQMGTWIWQGTGDESTPYSVTIQEINADNTPSTVTFNVAFTDAPPTVGANNPTASATEGVASVVSNMGTFSDFDDNVTITTNIGNVSQTPTGPSHSGTWLWSNSAPEEGSYIVTIFATNADLNVSSTQFTVNVADANLTGSSGATGTGGIEGMTAATLGNANFTDANTGAPTTDFTVTSASWGDTNTSTLGLSISGSAGSYTINGTHLYAEEGTYPVSFTVTDDGGKTAVITGSITVGDANLSGSSGASGTGGVEGVTAATLSNATFSDLNAGAPPTDFTVTSASWGDTSTLTTGLIITGSGGSYAINGTHMYAEEGTYPVSFTVMDDGGKTAVITGSITVGDANLAGSGGATGTGGIEGVTAATLGSASFTDANTGSRRPISR